MCLVDVWLIFEDVCDYAESKGGQLARPELKGMNSVVRERFFCTDYLEEVGVYLDEGVAFFDVFISVLPIAPLRQNNLLYFCLNVFLFDFHNRRLNHRLLLYLYPFSPLRFITLIFLFFHFDSYARHSLDLFPSFFLFLLLNQVVVHSALNIR